VNHAVLGAKTLLERNVLRDLPKRERSLIVRAVALHNVFILPVGLDDEILLHAKLIRDADKLDIWRVFIELSTGTPGTGRRPRVSVCPTPGNTRPGSSLRSNVVRWCG